MPTIVVDTNIIVDSCTGEGDSPMDCFLIFMKIHEGIIRLGVDSEGRILDEYKRNLNKLMRYPNAKMIKGFINKERWKTTGDRKIISYIPISEKYIKELLDMGFHRNDIKFVRIAPETDLKTIFSSDFRSFLNTNYSSWLEEKLGVLTKRPSDFPEFISNLP